MALIDLTVSQQSLLQALVNCYRDQEPPVKGADLASEIGRSPGTVRNQMQPLKTLDLVESVSGPNGGYKPTARAFEVLDIDQPTEAATVPLHRNGERVAGVGVEGITLMNVHHPEQCRAEIHLLGSLQDIHHGDELQVGPTPLAKLVIRGPVVGSNDVANLVILKIEGMRTDEPPA